MALLATMHPGADRRDADSGGDLAVARVRGRRRRRGHRRRPARAGRARCGRSRRRRARCRWTPTRRRRTCSSSSRSRRRACCRCSAPIRRPSSAFRRCLHAVSLPARRLLPTAAVVRRPRIRPRAGNSCSRAACAAPPAVVDGRALACVLLHPRADRRSDRARRRSRHLAEQDWRNRAAHRRPRDRGSAAPRACPADERAHLSRVRAGRMGHVRRGDARHRAESARPSSRRSKSTCT